MMKAATSFGTRAIHSEGYLFCRGHDGGFTSEEHIFTEGLGITTDYVLPKGVVCDRCNNGPLARADQAITDFEPIQLLRAERGLPTRSKRAVVSKWKDAELGFTGPGELVISGPGAVPARKIGPNTYQTDLRTTSPFKAKRVRLVARGIWKMAIELVYMDHGPRGAFDPTFDPVRDRILGTGDIQGWIVNPKDRRPHNQVQLIYETPIIKGRRALPVRLDVYGVQFYTDPLRPDLTHEQIEPTPWPANIMVF
jgi:hypothetical protein